jgi:uncharacterized membrane protein
MPGTRAWTDEQIEAIISNLLRAAIAVVSVIVVAGGVHYLLLHGAESPQYHIFRGEPPEYRSAAGAVAAALALRGRGMIEVGLLLLILTPVARVAFSALAFARQRDWTYVSVTATVLVILLYNLIGGYR